MKTFRESLLEVQQQNSSHVCIGLDPDVKLMPKGRTGQVIGHGSLAMRLQDFALEIVAATAKFACIFKPNAAFWAAHGAERELANVIDFILSKGLPVILDAKRGDIDNTARLYAQECFQRYGASAVTVNAYLGTDTLKPWLEYGPEKGIFVLCHTSNPGADEFQERVLTSFTTADSHQLFIEVAKKATARQTDATACVGLVMGATFPVQLGALVNAGIPETTPLLIPGIGKQAGALEETLGYARKFPFVVNSSRAIIHASQDRNFAEVAAQKAMELRDQINKVLAAV